MKPELLISAFLEVVENPNFSFAEQTIADLPTLEATLATLENQPLQLAADEVISWCKQHHDIRQAVIFTSQEISKRNHNNDNLENLPKAYSDDGNLPEANPAHQERTLANKFPRWRKQMQTRQQPNPNSGSDK